MSKLRWFRGRDKSDKKDVSPAKDHPSRDNEPQLPPLPKKSVRHPRDKSYRIDPKRVRSAGTGAAAGSQPGTVNDEKPVRDTENQTKPWTQGEQQTGPMPFVPIPKGALKERFPEPSRAQIQIAVVLPSPTVFMLQSEAACYGWRKSTFLEALLMQKLGMGIRLERSPNSPRYAFKPADFQESERWIWYLNPDLKKGFDQVRLNAGNIPARAWIIMAVNEWVGRPTGFGS